MGRPIIGLKHNHATTTIATTICIKLQTIVKYKVKSKSGARGPATDLAWPPVWVWASSVLLGSVLDRSFSAPGNRGDQLEAGHRRTEVIQPGEEGSSLNLSLRGKLQWKLNCCQSEDLAFSRTLSTSFDFHPLSISETPSLCPQNTVHDE